MDLIERAAEKLKQGEGQHEQARPAEPVQQPVAPPPSAGPSALPTQQRPSLDSGAPRGRKANIDLDYLRMGGFIVPDDAPTRVAEEFRIIKRQLLRKGLGQGDSKIDRGNLILVTSTQPGEGKTFCSINLALSIATERDLTVLLVDADVARPQMLSALGVEADRGLIDVIVDDRIELPDCLLRTNIENLTLLPAGRPHPAATELLASGKMGQLIDDLARRYPDRVIVFDSSPVLASSAPSVLAHHVGQVLFVVEADRTRESQLSEGLSLVADCKNINLMLNKARFQGGKVRFGSYYEYYRS